MRVLSRPGPFSRGGAFAQRGLLNRRRGAAAPLPEPGMASSVSERGATFTFHNAASGGALTARPVIQWWDGSWAVTHNGATLHVDIPSPAYVVQTGLTVGTEYPDGTRAKNGAMVNPGAAYVAGSRGANGIGTPGDVASNALGTSHGYDSRVGSQTALAYDPALNYHPGKTGTRLSFAPGVEATIAVAISTASPTGASDLDDVIYLTIVNTLPPAGSFRPGASAISKASAGLVADLDLSVLANDARPAFTLQAWELDPTIANGKAYVKLPNLTVQYTTGNIAEVISPANHHPAYGRDVARRYNIALSLLNENISAADKREIAAGICQIAIDHFDRIAQGGIFYANGQLTTTTAGGHDQYRMYLCAIAARLMRNLPRYAEFAGRVSDHLKWPERSIIGLVGEALPYQTTGGTHPNDETTAEPGGNARKQMFKANLGMPEDFPTGNSRWGKGYRHVSNCMVHPQIIQANRVNGALALINPTVLQLGKDQHATRYMDYEFAGITTTTNANKLWSYDKANHLAFWPQQQTGAATRQHVRFDGNTVWATYDRMLSVQAYPAASAFTVTVNGSARTINVVDVMGYAVILTIGGAALVETDTVVLDYVVPGSGWLRTVAGVAIGAITAVTATVPPLNTPSASFDKVQAVSGAYLTNAAIPALTNIQKQCIVVRFGEQAGATTGAILHSGSNNTRIVRVSATQIRVTFNSSTSVTFILTVSPSTTERTFYLTLDGTVTGAGGIVAYLDGTALTPSSVTNNGYNVTLNSSNAWNVVRVGADTTGAVFGGTHRMTWMWFGVAADTLPDLTNATIRAAFDTANQVGNNGRGPGNILPQPQIRIAGPLAKYNAADGMTSEGSYGAPWTQPVSGGSFAIAP